MATFHFELVSPERLVFAGEVNQVDVPGEEGEFGVLAGHAPYVATLKPGMLKIYGASGAIGTAPTGFGLGLTVARSAVNACGGDLFCRARSDGKPGAEFVLVLKKAAIKAQAANARD